MRVEIIRGTVEHNHRVYAIGDVIKQISRADGDRLIEKKAAVEYFEKPIQNESGNADDNADGDSETGGKNTIITTEDAGDDSTATPSEDDSETDETVDEDEE
jgi:hypothetical protein